MLSRFATFGEQGRLLPIPRKVAKQSEDPWGHVPDTAVEWADLEGLTVRGVSVRGHSHRWEGSVRQDQLAIGEVDDFLVCAVADGLGSQPESHIGSALAARLAVAWAKAGDLLSDEVTEFDCQEISTALEAEAKEWEVDPVAVSTTLTFAAIRRTPSENEDGTPCWTAAVAQIGDSPAYILRNGTWSALATDESAGTGLSNVVDPLPQHSRATVWQVELEPGDVLALTTDGVGALLEDVPDFAEAIGRRWAERPLSPSELLYYVDAAVKTYDDDRTLLAIGFGSADGATG